MRLPDRYRAFLKWCEVARMPISSIDEIDEALTWQMNESIFDGAPGTDGQKQLAALGYCVPCLTRGSPELIRARAAAVGWKRLSPVCSRLPTPWAVACMIINQLILMGHRVAAQAAAVTFVCCTYGLQRHSA